MEQVTYDFVLEATTPVAHHSESLGNHSILMTRRQRLPDGRWIHLPVVSGDTMRHQLREAGMSAYLEAAGVRDLTTAALRLLFAGGQIGGHAGSSVSISGYREMVDLCPPLALLGGCVNNRMVPGRMTVDEAILICEETLPMLPPWVSDWMAASGGATSPLRAHVEEATRVRMDPTLRPDKRAMLRAEDVAAEEQRLEASEAAAESGDAVAVQDTKGSSLPRTFERLAAGSLLYWQVRANCADELDWDTFHVMLGRFLGDAWVGGKRGTGHGHLRPVTARKIKVQTVSEVEGVDVGDVARRIGSRFTDHVSARAAQIAVFLAEVAA
jgi:hypothetical protein